MLVIGFNSSECIHASQSLEVDVDIDSPRKIHDALKKATGGNTDYSLVVVVDGDVEVASFSDGEDFDLSDSVADDDSDDDDEDETNPDALHEDGETDLDLEDIDTNE